MKRYNNRLFDLRRYMGLPSQTEFAKELGLSQQNYANYENGKQGLKEDLVERICTRYGCSADWLLGLTPEDARLLGAEFKPPIDLSLPIEMQPVEDVYPLAAKKYDEYPDAFLLKVEGESMNRILPNGSYALVDPCNDVDRDNKPYAVCVNGYNATIKRVRKLANGFELAPDSTDPTYKSKVYDYGEPGTETITIIGRVVYYVLPYDWDF